MVLHLIIETQGMSALEKEAAQTRVFMPSDKECQTITTQNTNRHCRVRFCAVVGQPSSKQLYTAYSYRELQLLRANHFR